MDVGIQQLDHGSETLPPPAAPANVAPSRAAKTEAAKGRGPQGRQGQGPKGQRQGPVARRLGLQGPQKESLLPTTI